MADLTGDSPAQDARIAALVKTWQPESNMWRGLENLFASHLRAREQARRLLQKMMTKAKSPELVDALHELNVPVCAAIDVRCTAQIRDASQPPLYRRLRNSRSAPPPKVAADVAALSRRPDRRVAADVRT